MRTPEFLSDASFYLQIPTAESDVHWEDVVLPEWINDYFDSFQDLKWLNYNVTDKGQRLFTYKTGLTLGGRRTGTKFPYKIMTGINCEGLNGFPDSDAGLGMNAYGWEGFLLYDENVGVISQIVEDKLWGKLKRQKSRGLYTDSIGNRQPMPGWWIAKFRYSKTSDSVVSQVPRQMDDTSNYLFYLIYVPPADDEENDIHLLRVSQNRGMIPSRDTTTLPFHDFSTLYCWPQRKDSFAFGMRGFNQDLVDETGISISPEEKYIIEQFEKVQAGDYAWEREELGLEKVGEFWVMSYEFWNRNNRPKNPITWLKDFKGRKFWRNVKRAAQKTGLAFWNENRAIRLKDYHVLKSYRGHKKTWIPDPTDSEIPAWKALEPYNWSYKGVRDVGDVLQRPSLSRGIVYVDYLQLSPKEFDKSCSYWFRAKGYHHSWSKAAEALTSSGHLAYLGPSVTGQKVEEQHLSKKKYTGMPPFKMIALINYNVRLPRVVREWTHS